MEDDNQRRLRLCPPQIHLLFAVAVGMARRRRQQREDEEERQRPRKRLWVHPINTLRPERGHLGQLYHELRQMLRLLAPHLLHQDTTMREAISPTERLLITLWFLATGESFASLHLQFRVGKSTISGIVRCTCHLIWQHLQPIVMPSPTQEIWLQAAAGFQSVANFPNCIGAVDGKHIRVQKPPHSGSLYFNYKKYFSVVLMAVADATYRFIAIEVGAYGSTGDSRALLSSILGRRVLVDQVTLPPPRPLPGATHPVPFVMVGDEAFPLKENLLRPFPRRSLDARKRVFNMRLSRARRFVECTFGILTSKWRVLTSAMQLAPDTVTVVVKAVCMLHNYVREYESPNIVVEPQAALSDPIVTTSGHGRAADAAVRVRDSFADYFMSPEGAVPWQFSQPRDEQPEWD
ncbi:uncharacterized protein RB166_002254 [Leptodactylus fuscus]